MKFLISQLCLAWDLEQSSLSKLIIKYNCRRNVWELKGINDFSTGFGSIIYIQLNTMWKKFVLPGKRTEFESKSVLSGSID